jgi:uncharacterized protein with NRDE domain
MCTVSFVNSNGKYIITSNRDEKVLRSNALAPKNYLINNKKILFPKDAQAGGTWYAANDKGDIAVLLNGAKEKHNLKPSYRKSRGLIVLDLISATSIVAAWQLIDLEGIEPFTLVVFESKKLYQLQWNELEKEKLTLDTSISHIWSSSTLYSKEIREERASWFTQFMTQKLITNEEDLFDFHSNTEEHDSENGLVINRNGILKTVSISQTVIDRNKISFHYHDLTTDQKNTNTFTVI